MEHQIKKIKTETKLGKRKQKTTKIPKMKIACDLCEYMARDAFRLKMHKRVVHDGITFDCNMCDYKESPQ